MASTAVTPRVTRLHRRRDSGNTVALSDHVTVVLIPFTFLIPFLSLTPSLPLLTLNNSLSEGVTAAQDTPISQGLFEAVDDFNGCYLKLRAEYHNKKHPHQTS